MNETRTKRELLETMEKLNKQNKKNKEQKEIGYAINLHIFYRLHFL